jgi:hypothetical protein
MYTAAYDTVALMQSGSQVTVAGSIAALAVTAAVCVYNVCVQCVCAAADCTHKQQLCTGDLCCMHA